jgi:uncharacterized protein (TIGR02444 family)
VTDEPWPTSALWNYAVELYGRPGVRDACLALQDRAGADVNLLLLACWLGATGRRLDPAALARLRTDTLAWQEAVVRPLRTARRELKRRLAELNPALRPPLAAARARLAEVELAAERAELLTLEAGCGQSGVGTADPLLAVDALRHIAALSDPDCPSVEVLLAAAFPTLFPNQVAVLARAATEADGPRPA